MQPSRIVGIDFWRGLALVMIFINHMPENPLTRLTLKVMGFADAAEMFVFLAGISAAHSLGAYYGLYGAGEAIKRCMLRAWRLFRAHIMLVFGMCTVIAIAGLFTDSTPIKHEFNFSPFFFETDQAILRLLRLAYMPNLTDILPLYVLLILLFPLFWGLLRSGTGALLVISLSVWYMASQHGLSPNDYPDNMVWHFNPLAWQLIFVLGIVAYHHRDSLTAFARRPGVLLVAAGVALFSFLLAAPWIVGPQYEGWRLLPAEWLRFDNKTDLSAVRVVHFLALAVLAVRYGPALQRALHSGVTEALECMGRHSLFIFCLGAMLSLSSYVAYRLFALSPGVYAALSVMGIVILMVAAQLAERLMARPTAPAKLAA